MAGPRQQATDGWIEACCAICESRWRLRVQVVPEGWICSKCRTASQGVTNDLHRIVRQHYEPKARWN